MMHCDTSYWDRRYEWRQEEYRGDRRQPECGTFWNSHRDETLEIKGQECISCPFPGGFPGTKSERMLQGVSAAT